MRRIHRHFPFLRRGNRPSSCDGRKAERGRCWSPGFGRRGRRPAPVRLTSTRALFRSRHRPAADLWGRLHGQPGPTVRCDPVAPSRGANGGTAGAELSAQREFPFPQFPFLPESPAQQSPACYPIGRKRRRRRPASKRSSMVRSQRGRSLRAPSSREATVIRFLGSTSIPAKTPSFATLPASSCRVPADVGKDQSAAHGSRKETRLGPAGTGQADRRSMIKSNWRLVASRQRP